MSTSDQPARLVAHRAAFERSGDRMPLLSVDQLTHPERELLGREIIEAITQANLGPDDGFKSAAIQAGVLASWGVMCPHPESVREPIGDLTHLGDNGHPGPPVQVPICRCLACGTAIFPDKWRIALHRLLRK